MESLQDLFVHQLQGAYRTERHLVDSLDEMARNAEHDAVAGAFADHRDETKQHAERLRSVFEALDLEPQERPVPVVEALDEERAAVEETVRDEELLDVFYVNAGVKTERIELTAYEGLLVLARRLELDDEVVEKLEANRDGDEDALQQLQTMTTASNLDSLFQRLLP